MDGGMLGGVAAVIALVGGIVAWVMRSVVKDVARAEIQPLSTELREHMRAETEGQAAMNVKLEQIHADLRVNQVEHAAFDSRIGRLEDKQK